LLLFSLKFILAQSISLSLNRLNTILEQATELEKQHKTPSWDSAKVIYDEFTQTHMQILKDFSDIDIPLIDYDDSAQEYMSDKIIQIIKVKCKAISDVLTDHNGINKNNLNTLEILENLFSRFHNVSRQLRNRYSNRDTLDVSDEYDVQDLLHSLLKINFKDIRAEEWTPSYAGKSSRMDFLLKEEEIVIEVKMTRKGLGEREIGSQLLEDIGRYQVHPNCKTLLCFVYDPQGIIGNPDGLETDLNKEIDNMIVKTFIRPNS